MTVDKKDKVMSRIKKLLALSKNNPSEEEAISAAEMARTLMLKYDLSEADVDDADAKDVIEYRVKRRCYAWMVRLSQGVCSFMGSVDVVIATNYRNRRCHHVVFIGSKNDCELAEYLLEFFIKWVRSETRKVLDVKFNLDNMRAQAIRYGYDTNSDEFTEIAKTARRTYRYRFINSCADGVRSKLSQVAMERKAAAAAKTTKIEPGQGTAEPTEDAKMAALVLCKSAATKDYMDKTYKNARKAKLGSRGSAGCRDGFVHGRDNCPMPNMLNEGE